jgi:hypothetical protein
MTLVLPLPRRSWRRQLARTTCALAIALLGITAIQAQAAGPDARQARAAGEITEDPKDDGDPALGWKRTTITAIDDDTGKEFSTEIYQITGERGVALAPIPEQIREELITEMAAAEKGEDVTFALNAPIMDEIQKSLELGEPTEALIAYSKLDTLENDPNARGPFGSCSDKAYSRSKSFQFATPLNHTTNLGNGFTGTVSVTGSSSVNATGQVQINLKRTKVFWVCIPYGVRFGHVRATGSVSLDEEITLNGTISYANPNLLNHQVAKPHLGGFSFWIGPVPVYIGFNLPITVGAKLEASATAQLQYRAGHRLSGSFDYTCTSNNCSGWNNIVQTQTNPVNNPVGLGASVRVKPTVYADVGVRGYLYSEGVAYAQVGVRGYLHGDLWGYYGNTCGDANQDGTYETVNALTFDLDWQIAITGKADTFFTSAWQGTIWQSRQYHIGFWILDSGTALTPMIERTRVNGDLGTNTIFPQNTPVNFKLRMRPCWPYADAVDYSMNWGDGAVSGHTGAPATASHTWSTQGNTSLNLTAFRDAHGRVFGNGRTTTKAANIVYIPVNLAPTATAFASSTYCDLAAPELITARKRTTMRIADGSQLACNSPRFVRDGNPATAWMNSVWITAATPQWIELRWTTPVPVTSMKIHGDAGWGNGPADYDIEYWSGSAWVKVAIVRGNTDSLMEHAFTPTQFQTTKLRVLIFNGGFETPATARINEIEVY